MFSSKTIPSDYFSMQKKVLRIFGISLYENESIFYRIYSFVFLLATIYTYGVLEFFEFFKGHDFDVMVLVIIYETSIIMDVIKVSVILLNRKKLINILWKLERGIFAPDPDRGGEIETKLILNCISSNNLQCMIYWVAAILSNGSAMIYTFLKRLNNEDPKEWDFPFGSFTILNVTRSPDFEISLIYQDLNFIVNAFTFSTADLLFVGLLAHVSVQLRIVQNNFRNLVEISYRNMMKGVTNAPENDKLNDKIDASCVCEKYLKESLKNIVLHHISVTELAKDIEDIYGTSLLIIFQANVLLLCFVLYYSLSFSMAYGMMTTSVTLISAVCFQLFVICYWCDEVSNQSIAVGAAVYEANFIGVQLKFQKDLAFVVRRSQKPIVLTARKFFGISLRSFTTIMRTSYSLFMIIRGRKSSTPSFQL